MMRKLLFVLLVLLALGAIPASAIFVPSWGYDNTEYDYFPPATYNESYNYVTMPDEAGVTAFCAALGHGTHSSSYGWKSFTDNTSAYGGSGALEYGANVTITGSYNYTAFTFSCDGVPHWGKVAYKDSLVTATSANFTATPRSGDSPIYILLEDTSESAPFPITSWNWSISPATGWWAAPDTLDDEDVTIYFTQSGNYSVTHGASNGYTSDIETKTDYISIFNATASNKTVYLTVMDGVSGKFVNGYTANVYDTDNSRWTNATPTDGILVITTTTGATLTANLTANGYITKVDSKILRDDDWPEDWVVTMFKAGDQPNSTNLTATSLRLWVTSEGLSLPGASVQISDGQAMFTPDSGIAQFTVVNGTEYNWEVNKYPAFAGATGVITASGAVTNVNVNLIRITGTQPIPTTTGPGGSTPVPTPTLTGKALEEHNAEMDQKMMSQLRDAGPQIIDLAILVIIMSLVGMLITGFKFK